MRYWLKCERTGILLLEVSKHDAEKVLRHPEIYAAIRDDGSPPANELFIPDGWISVVVYIDEPVACFVLHELNSATMVCHVQILPDYRYLSHDIGISVIGWTKENTDARKLIAWIPFDRENVKIFAESMGFAVEGISEDSIMKDGKLQPQWLMGLRLWD